MSEVYYNIIINEFLDNYFGIVSPEVQYIFNKYFKDSATYDEIGSFYGITRQAVQNKVARNLSNMKNMLEGKVYKKIYASLEIIKLKADIENMFNKNEFFSILDLKTIGGIDYTNNSHYVKVFLSIIDIYIYDIDGDYLLSFVKHNLAYLVEIYKAIVSILNDSVFGIDEFTLITRVKKYLNSKRIKNEEIISLCKAIKTVELNNNTYFLVFNKLTSYEKKAMRILDDSNKPMDGREIAIEIFSKSNDLYNEEKIGAVINQLIRSTYIESVGKTGIWVLNTWEYEAKFHTEIIKKIFQDERRALSAREIYAKVCTKRSDLSLSKIQSYLYSKKELFIQVDSDLFIIPTWRKMYAEKINKFRKTQKANKNFDAIILDIFERCEKLSINEILNKVKEMGVGLSAGRIRAKLKHSQFISEDKVKNRIYYFVNDKKEDRRKEFLYQVMNLFKETKNGIENRGADVCLKNNSEPKDETDIQIALFEFMRGYFAKDDIDVSREAWTGRGPVDFKFSQGFSLKVFLELKLAKNQNLYEGLEAQLTQYMGSDVVKYGIFIVVLFIEDDFNKITEIEYKLKEIERKYKMVILFEYIDARGGRPSPSKLKKGNEDILIDLIK